MILNLSKFVKNVGIRFYCDAYFSKDIYWVNICFFSIIKSGNKSSDSLWKEHLNVHIFCLLIAHFTISYFLIHLIVEITLLNISLSVVCL